MMGYAKVRPFLVMSSDERRVVEEIFERATVRRLVREGDAAWIPGRRAVRLLSENTGNIKKGWRPCNSGGATVLQLVEQ